MSAAESDATMQDADQRANQTFVVHCNVRRPTIIHEVKIFKSEARADAWIVNRIRHYNLNPDPDPETGRKEFCDLDPCVVAWGSNGLSSPSLICKLTT